MYSYTIYTKESWSVLAINSPTQSTHVVHESTILLLQGKHASNVIVLVPSTMFQTYDITSCDTLCDHDHMPLHHPKEK